MGKNIRIAFLADGESVHTKKWVGYFAEKGYDVHLITFATYHGARSRVKPINGVKIHELRHFGRFTTNFAFPLMIWKTWKVVKEISPDILHAHYVLHYGSFGALTGFEPFVVTAWGSDILIGPRESAMKRYLVSYTLKKANLITCDGEHIMELIERMGVISEKIRLIHFGVDTTKFSLAQKSEKLRAELGIYDLPTAISLRNLEPLYDVESLIKSVPLVLKEIPESQFVIAGRGSEERRLRGLAKSLGVSKSVKFVGFIPNDELPRYLTSMDVYVSTSLSDAGIAASTAEAMACGLPVIITDFGDNRKWVKDGVNGFVIPLRDPDSLAEKIVYLLKNENVRATFGKINRKIIEEKNNYYKEMKKVESVYEELAEMHTK